MNDVRDLAALAQLAGLASGAAEARLALLTRKADDLRNRLADLYAARRARADAPDSLDTAMMAGADLRWHRWIDSRRSALNAELARAQVDIARGREALRRAFGQKLAAEDLAARGRAQAQHRRERRAERDQLS